MPGPLQVPILGLRGPIPSLGEVPRRVLRKQSGRKRLVFIFGRGAPSTSAVGPSMAHFTPLARALAAPLTPDNGLPLFGSGFSFLTIFVERLICHVLWERTSWFLSKVRLLSYKSIHKTRLLERVDNVTFCSHIGYLLLHEEAIYMLLHYAML